MLERVRRGVIRDRFDDRLVTHEGAMARSQNHETTSLEEVHRVAHTGPAYAEFGGELSLPRQPSIAPEISYSNPRGNGRTTL